MLQGGKLYSNEDEFREACFSGKSNKKKPKAYTPALHPFINISSVIIHNVTSFKDQSKEPSKIMQVFTDKATSYKRGSFDYKNKPNLVIDMLLNNMKIEGQEVDRKEFLELLDEQNAS